MVETINETTMNLTELWGKFNTMTMSSYCRSKGRSYAVQSCYCTNIESSPESTRKI